MLTTMCAMERTIHNIVVETWFVRSPCRTCSDLLTASELYWELNVLECCSMVGGGGGVPANLAHNWFSYNMCVPTNRYSTSWKKEHPLFPIRKDFLTGVSRDEDFHFTFSWNASGWAYYFYNLLQLTKNIFNKLWNSTKVFLNCSINYSFYVLDLC
jgi:hypothetical protein